LTNSTLVITLLPALPLAWNNGEIQGVHIRGGIVMSMKWSNRKPSMVTFTVAPNPVLPDRDVQVIFGAQTIASFKTSPNLIKSL
jgi:alpha-L-fucosidase 2